jgi:hypothetical protein
VNASGRNLAAFLSTKHSNALQPVDQGNHALDRSVEQVGGVLPECRQHLPLPLGRLHRETAKLADNVRIAAGEGGWRAWSKLDRRRSVVSAIERGLSSRAAHRAWYVGGLSRGTRTTSRPGIKVSTARRIGSRPMPSASFHSRRRNPRPFSPMLSKRPPQNIAGRRFAHTNVSVRPTNARPTSTNVG